MTQESCLMHSFFTSYNIELSNRFSALQNTGDMQNTWINFQEAVTGAAQTILGRLRGTKKERWITDSTWNAIDERKALKKLKLQAESTGRDVETIKVIYKEKDKEVKKRCKADKQQWFDDKVKEAENAANTGDSKRLFDIVKELTGHRIQRTHKVCQSI